MSDLARLSATPCTDHVALALALSDELGGGDRQQALRSLQSLARELHHDRGPAAELTALGELLAARLVPDEDGPLQLPEALSTGTAHPTIVAIAGAGVADLCGIDVGIVGGDGLLYLAHRELAAPRVLDPAAPERPFDARTLGIDLMWHCAHETSLQLLDHVIERAEFRLDIATALAGAALRLSFPLEAAPLASAHAEYRRLAANLN